ncbi:hypothetical protein HPP92_021665 [Vanilla planifolia]|uniref:NAC domain-containing protein n=1 Tax=Vanilla planifolia TaxID=51239 RepID=A0A835PYK7_VANPL|nr:hypothetical protein HPP92_021665 [Vanilla planifolia]
MEEEGQQSSQFPPGFRFHPTDQELIKQYLWKKATGSLPMEWAIIADIDLYKFNPWELPEKALFGQGEWFFFSPRDRKYPNGVRPNRAAGLGYWKATGTDKPILAAGSAQCIGVKKALVFYRGRPPKGTKTEWIMQEYRLLDSMAPSQNQKHKGSMRVMRKQIPFTQSISLSFDIKELFFLLVCFQLDDWVLCRVRRKGSLPEGSGREVMENSTCLVNSRAEEKHMVTRERSGSDDFGEHLGYLLESPIEGRENGLGGLTMWSSNRLDRLCDEKEQLQQQQQQQALLHPPAPRSPGKGLQCSADDWYSETESVSAEHFPEYFIH